VVLVQVKGSQRSFQPSMKVRIAAMRSLNRPGCPETQVVESPTSVRAVL
jgi:hypothetical protein